MADATRPFTRTFFGDTPDDPPFMLGDRMAIHALKSINYVAGSTGWRISNEGDVEFNDITLRGTLQSDNFVAGTSGWRLLDTGAAEMSQVTIRGSSVLAGASISGDLTMTGSGKIKTAASGRRLEIATSTTSRVTIYTGDAAEQAPGYLDFVSAGDVLYNEVRSPQAQGDYAYVRVGANKVTPNSTVDVVADNTTVWGSLTAIGPSHSLQGTTTIQATSGGGNIVELWDPTGPTRRTLVERSNGRIHTSLGTDGSAIVGQWNGSNAYAMFAHLTQVQENSNYYAVLQGKAGSADENTYINARTGDYIGLRIGNSEIAKITANNIESNKAGSGFNTQSFYANAAGKTGIGAGQPGVVGAVWYVNTADAERWHARSSGDGGYVPILASAFTVSSAANTKENIRTEAFEPDLLHKLRPVRFRRKADPHSTRRVGAATAALFGGEVPEPDEQPETLGLVADELIEILPEAVALDIDGNPLGIDLGVVMAAGIGLMQQVERRLAAIEAAPVAAAALKGKK